LLNKMAQMCDARLIDPAMLKQCQDGMICDNAELAAFLEGECDGDAALLLALAGNKPGRGGISRGRGDAPMTWTEGSDEAGAGFREETISPAALSNLKKTKLLGVSMNAPGKSDGTPPATPGALSDAAAGGGAAHRHLILPKHKRAVRQYFERNEP
jgi:hypothetical protein